jgi:hypothetical protein
MTWRRHVERTVAESLCAYVRSEYLRVHIKLAFYNALIKSKDLRVSHLEICGGHSPPQIRVLRAIGNFDRRIPVRELHVAFKIPYV